MTKHLGDSIDSITPDMLGSAEKAVSDIDGTVLVMDKSDEVKDKIESIKELLEDEDHPVLLNHLKQRLGLLNGGVAIIKVGADTEVELKEKLDRVDDAVAAVAAARKEGILPGGGAALAHIARNWVLTLNQGELRGAEILQDAMEAPIELILENSGLCLCDYEDNTWHWGQGVDATDGIVKNMTKVGIIDPAMVTKEALSNAVSVALTVLSTDCVISNMRDNESN